MTPKTTVPVLTFAPGERVRHPACLEWGLGQVQSVDGDRVTINFEHAGKQLIKTSIVELVLVND